MRLGLMLRSGLVERVRRGELERTGLRLERTLCNATQKRLFSQSSRSINMVEIRESFHKYVVITKILSNSEQTMIML